MDRNHPLYQKALNLQLQVAQMQAANQVKRQQMDVREAALRQGTVPVSGPQDVLTNMRNILPDYLVPGNLGDVNKVIWPFWFTNQTPELPAAKGGVMSQATASVTITQEAAFIVTAYMKSVFRRTTIPGALPPTPNYGVLAGLAVNNTGASTVNAGANGNVGVAPGAIITGFPPGVASGTLDSNNIASQLGQTQLLDQFLALGNLDPTADLSGQDLGGKTLPPGVYKFSSGAQLSGVLTLSGAGQYVFQIDSGLVVTTGSSVVLTNGANAGNVFWQVDGSVVVGAAAVMVGNIEAEGNIMLKAGASLNGRALSISGVVTMDTNAITAPAVAVLPNQQIYTYQDPACCEPGQLNPGLAMTLQDAQSSRVFMSNPIDLDTVGDGIYPTELPTPIMFLPNSVIKTQLFNSNPVNNYIPWISFIGVRCRIEDAQRIMSLITG